MIGPSAPERNRSAGGGGRYCEWRPCRVLAQGDTIKLERLSYRSFQKNFGRSVKRRAPGMFVSMLKRKAAGTGARIIEFATRNTRLSQFCRVSGEYVKKPLSQRHHAFPDGSCVQRDLYSAWLERFVEEDTLDASRLDKGGHFAAWESPSSSPRNCAPRSNRCAKLERVNNEVPVGPTRHRRCSQRRDRALLHHRERLGRRGLVLNGR
ncbi:MAG TPA: hypothetical protein VGM59_08230 [Dongiaceae bacterium]